MHLDYQMYNSNMLVFILVFKYKKCVLKDNSLL
jgi:hypothetical protein